MKTRLLTTAALSGLLLAAGCSHYGHHSGPASGSEVAMGQCHGVNACKGKGDCAAKGHDCAGENSCEGKGWLKMSKGDCGMIKGSNWMPMPPDMKHKKA